MCITCVVVKEKRERECDEELEGEKGRACMLPAVKGRRERQRERKTTKGAQKLNSNAKEEREGEGKTGRKKGKERRTPNDASPEQPHDLAT